MLFWLEKWSIFSKWKNVVNSTKQNYEKYTVITVMAKLRKSAIVSNTFYII